MQKKISFYLDEHIARVVKEGLEKRGLQGTMAVEVGMSNKDDDTEHLPYAAERGFVLLTNDRAFGGRSQHNQNHAGLICWTGKGDDFGGMVKTLAEFAEAHTPDDVRGRVFWLK